MAKPERDVERQHR